MTAQPYDDYEKHRSRFTASFMNDSKWVRLFSAVADAGIHIERARWSFIDTEQVLDLPFPSVTDLLPSRFADGRFQCIEYKWIRSVVVPREYRRDPQVAATRQQNVDHLAEVLRGAGQFQVSETPEALAIFAYGEIA